MPQQLTPLILKGYLETLLAGVIGTYTHTDNGYTMSAIAIGNPPNKYTASGVELIIPLFPDIPQSQWLAGDVHRRELWDLILILHDGNRLTECVDRLTRFFITGHGVFLPASSAYGTKAQYRFTFTHQDLYEGLKLNG